MSKVKQHRHFAESRCAELPGYTTPQSSSSIRPFTSSALRIATTSRHSVELFLPSKESVELCGGGWPAKVRRVKLPPIRNRGERTNYKKYRKNKEKQEQHWSSTDLDSMACSAHSHLPIPCTTDGKISRLYRHNQHSEHQQNINQHLEVFGFRRADDDIDSDTVTSPSLPLTSSNCFSGNGSVVSIDGTEKCSPLVGQGGSSSELGEGSAGRVVNMTTVDGDDDRETCPSTKAKDKKEESAVGYLMLRLGWNPDGNKSVNGVRKFQDSITTETIRLSFRPFSVHLFFAAIDEEEGDRSMPQRSNSNSFVGDRGNEDKNQVEDINHEVKVEDRKTILLMVGCADDPKLRLYFISLVDDKSNGIKIVVRELAFPQFGMSALSAMNNTPYSSNNTSFWWEDDNDYHDSSDSQEIIGDEIRDKDIHDECRHSDNKSANFIHKPQCGLPLAFRSPVTAFHAITVRNLLPLSPQLPESSLMSPPTVLSPSSSHLPLSSDSRFMNYIAAACQDGTIRIFSYTLSLRFPSKSILDSASGNSQKDGGMEELEGLKEHQQENCRHGKENGNSKSLYFTTTRISQFVVDGPIASLHLSYFPPPQWDKSSPSRIDLIAGSLQGFVCLFRRIISSSSSSSLVHSSFFKGPFNVIQGLRHNYGHDMVEKDGVLAVTQFPYCGVKTDSAVAVGTVGGRLILLSSSRNSCKMVREPLKSKGEWKTIIPVFTKFWTHRLPSPVHGIFMTNSYNFEPNDDCKNKYNDNIKNEIIRFDLLVITRNCIHLFQGNRRAIALVT